MSAEIKAGESSEVLATIHRGSFEEIRVIWERNLDKPERPFLTIRAYSRNEKGEFVPDPKRGLNIWASEMPELVKSISLVARKCIKYEFEITKKCS